MISERTCCACKTKKLLDAFPVYGSRRQTRCLDCCRAYGREWYHKNKERRVRQATEWNRNNRRKRHSYWIHQKHGITLDEYEAMLVRQGGVCAICKEPETVRHNNGQTRRLPIDHDHATGQIRDLLCYRCNSMIGYSREREDLLLAAIDYLKKHKSHGVAAAS